MNFSSSLNPPSCSRRRVLQIGGLGCLGLNLPRLLQAEALSGGSGAADSARLKSCILVFYYGGPSHLDTWDMKPEAAAEVRGEFRPIATSAPGVQICEHLPRMARVMDKVCLLRGMHHPMRNHNAAAVEALCGRTPLGGDQELLADDALSFPCYGSLLSYKLRDQRLELPHVALPHVMYNVVKLPGQTAGFLGSSYEPFQIQADPNAPNFNVSELQLPGDVDSRRLNNRQALVATIDRGQQAAAEAAAASMRTYYDKAFSLLVSEDVRRSLDLSREPEPLRERYGRNTHGQSVLLARRLVESGVRFVSVFDKVHNGQEANWDSHASVFPRHRDHLLPPADQALSALIEDLADRGLLDSTLVIALGEFGRSPRINGAAGRDHWPDCFSVVLAGGGVKGGFVYGASDAVGAYPETDAVTPGELAATLYAGFGLDVADEIHDLTGRPYRLSDGRPLDALSA